jgi:hypothetical protein
VPELKPDHSAVLKTHQFGKQIVDLRLDPAELGYMHQFYEGALSRAQPVSPPRLREPRDRL